MTKSDLVSIEDALLVGLDTPGAPALDLLKAYERLAAVAPEKAADFIDMLQDRFIEAADDVSLAGLFAVIARAFGERDQDSAFRSDCLKQLLAIAEVRRDRRVVMFLEHAGFDKTLPVSECIRRLQLLRALAPGVLCMDSSRGFGVVVALDEFARQVVVDYEGKRAHRLGLAYAAECWHLSHKKACGKHKVCLRRHDYVVKT